MPDFPNSTTVLDSILFRDAFGTPAMREVFSDFSLISRCAEVEIALASIRGNISIARKGSASGGLRKNSTLVIQSIFRCTTMEKETDRND